MVIVGLAVGFDVVVELKAVAGVQLYVFPDTDAEPSTTLCKLHIV